MKAERSVMGNGEVSVGSHDIDGVNGDIVLI